MVVFLRLPRELSDTISIGIVLPSALWILHFLKRTAESAWLHRSGKTGVKWRDAILVYGYYWGFGFWIASAVCSNFLSPPGTSCIAVGVAVFVVSEIGNFRSHLILRRLRSGKTMERRIPHGFLFEYVSCPHYFFEIMSWVGFTLATGFFSAAVFTVVGAVILTIWAHQRHQAYKHEFDGREGKPVYPPMRKAIFPFLY